MPIMYGAAMPNRPGRMGDARPWRKLEQLPNPHSSANVRVRCVRRTLHTGGKSGGVDMDAREYFGVGFPGVCVGGGVEWMRRGDSNRACGRGRIRDIELGGQENLPPTG